MEKLKRIPCAILLFFVIVLFIAMIPLLLFAYLLAYVFIGLYAIFSKLMHYMGWSSLVVKLDKYI